MFNRRQLVCLVVCLATGIGSSMSAHATTASIPTSSRHSQHILTVSGGRAGDAFGSAVAISKGVAVVGAPNRTVNGHPGQGAAYVFVKPSSGTWRDARLATILTVGQGQAGDAFGLAVTVAGNTIAVAAPLVTSGSYKHEGAVYLFEKPSGGWSNIHHPTARLTPSDPAAGDLFGSALASQSDTIVVGSPGHVVGQHYGQGAAYVFVRPQTGWAARNTEDRELTATNGDAYAELGYSVALSGSKVVAGAPYDQINGQPGQGSAYLFAKPSSGWQHAKEQARFTVSNGAKNDYFGYAVAIAGWTVAVGAPYRTVDQNAKQGATYVFNRGLTGWSDANQDATLTVSPGVPSAFFGTGVAISGSHIIASGYVVDSVFNQPSGGWHGSHHQQADLTGMERGDVLGKAVAASGAIVIAGAPTQTVGHHVGQGAAYTFVR